MSKVVVITGANKGLGLEAARQLLERGHRVVAGARDPERGRRAAEELGPGARFVPLDVTDEDSVLRAAEDVAAHEGHVDVLINNAGVGGEPAGEELSGAEASRIFDTNVVGPVRTTAAFLPLLRAAESPVVVNVSSGLGSQERTHDPERIEGQVVAPLYNASKAALTMLTTQWARQFPEIRFNAADPGFTATAINDHQGTQTLAEGVEAVVALATEPADAGTGRVVDRFGPVPW